MTVLPYLVEGIASLPETVIVLDDYHVVRCREIHEIITYNRAVELVGVYIESIWEYGDQTRLTSWITAIPEPIRINYPEILAHYAFALCFSGAYDEAEHQLLFAESRGENITESFRGKAATVRAYYSLYRNRIESADEFSRCALELLVALKRMGRLGDAAETFDEQLSRAVKRGYSQVAGALYAVWGDILLEWNRLDEAEECIHRGLSLSERQNYAAGIAWSMISTADILFSRGNHRAAEETLENLEARIRKDGLPAWTRNWLNAWKSRCFIFRGHPEKAEKLLAEHGISADGEIAYPREVEYLAFSRLLMEAGSLDEALFVLSRLEDHL